MLVAHLCVYPFKIWLPRHNCWTPLLVPSVHWAFTPLNVTYPQVYACTVGQKPSRAPFYLNDPGEVLHMLARLVGINLHKVPSYS